MLLHLLKIKIVVLLIIFLASSLLFNGPNNEVYDETYLNGIRYYSEKNYSKALEIIDKSKSSSDAAVYLKYKSYYHLENYKKVIELSTNQVKNKYLNEMKKVYLSLSYYELEDYALSIKTAAAIKEKDRYIKFFKFKILADSFYSKKDYKNAVLNYLNIINKTYFMRGHKVKNEFLIKNFEENIFLNLFYSYYNLNQFSNCISAFNKYFSYIKNEKKKDEILLLMHEIIQANKLKIKNKTRFSLGRGLYYTDKKKIAGNYFKKLISSPDKSSYILKAYFFLALIHKKDGPLFNKYLKEMLKKFKSSDKSLYHYARAHYLVGKKDKAFNYYKDLISKGKEIKSVKSAYLDLIDNYKNKKEHTEFIKKFYLKFKSDTQASWLYFVLGLERLNDGDIISANEIFKKLDDNKHYSIRSTFLSGKIYYNQKDYKNAFQNFFKVIEKADMGFYFIKSIEYFKSLDKDDIKAEIVKKIEKYKHNKLKYNLLLYIVLGKEEHKKEVHNLLDKKSKIKGLVFGEDKNNLKNDRIFSDYLFFRRNGLYDEAYLLYRILRKKYKTSVNFYYSMLFYSVNNNWLGSSLIFRNYILYRKKLSPYLICIDKEYLDYYYPSHYKEEISEVIKSRSIKINKNLIFSLIREESRFDRLALSPADAMGLFQIIPSTAEWIKKKLKHKTDDTIYNVHLNTLFGIYYFNSLLKKDDPENIIYALGSYNAGSRRVYKWKKRCKYTDDYPELFIELIPINETRNYVKKILTSYYMYSIK